MAAILAWLYYLLSGGDRKEKEDLKGSGFFGPAAGRALEVEAGKTYTFVCTDPAKAEEFLKSEDSPPLGLHEKLFIYFLAAAPFAYTYVAEEAPKKKETKEAFISAARAMFLAGGNYTRNFTPQFFDELKSALYSGEVSVASLRCTEESEIAGNFGPVFRVEYLDQELLFLPPVKRTGYRPRYLSGRIKEDIAWELSKKNPLAYIAFEKGAMDENLPELTLLHAFFAYLYVMERDRILRGIEGSFSRARPGEDGIIVVFSDPPAVIGGLIPYEHAKNMAEDPVLGEVLDIMYNIPMNPENVRMVYTRVFGGEEGYLRAVESSRFPRLFGPAGYRAIQRHFGSFEAFRDLARAAADDLF